LQTSVRGALAAVLFLHDFRCGCATRVCFRPEFRAGQDSGSPVPFVCPQPSFPHSIYSERHLRVEPYHCGCASHTHTCVLPLPRAKWCDARAVLKCPSKERAASGKRWLVAPGHTRDIVEERNESQLRSYGERGIGSVPLFAQLYSILACTRAHVEGG